MAGSFTAVDLSQLPTPTVVELLDFETIFSEMLSDFIIRNPDFDALVESDPAYKILEVAAYRELIIRQRCNEAAVAVMLAFARGTDLDQIAARYNVTRLLIQAADDTQVPPVAAVYENDDSLRLRTQFSFESFSVAGPVGAYKFHSLGADADVLDAGVTSLAAGTVNVAVLSRTGNGAAPSGLLLAVNAALSSDDVRPLTDLVLVTSAQILPYSVAATLEIFDGPDSEVVLSSARTAMQAYADASHRLGQDVTLSGIYAALHQSGVQNVVLTAPVASILTEWNQAPYCTGIVLASSSANG